MHVVVMMMVFVVVVMVLHGRAARPVRRLLPVSFNHNLRRRKPVM
jgi:hypothetical protein